MCLGSKNPIQVDNVSSVVDDIIGSIGLELKMDLGVAPVYTGFGGLMLTTVISYLSHSQQSFGDLRICIYVFEFRICWTCGYWQVQGSQAFEEGQTCFGNNPSAVLQELQIQANLQCNPSALFCSTTATKQTTTCAFVFCKQLQQSSS